MYFEFVATTVLFILSVNFPLIGVVNQILQGRHNWQDFQSAVEDGINVFPSIKVVVVESVTFFYPSRNHTRAIITRGLYTFYPLFEVYLCKYCDIWP